MLRSLLIASLLAVPILAQAHGGGLDGQGCHTNRKTGDYHCHRGGGSNSAAAPAESRQVAAPAAAPSNSGGATCFTGPRGGTYTITKSGRKNYSGC
ncbi:MAG TPA: YHYH domain-containing protein [Ramlibacter sp.]|jgi:hypothetical protein